MRRTSFTFFLLALCFGVLDSAAQVTTVAGPTTWTNKPVDNEVMNRRIAEAAENYKDFAPIPRIAFFDLGYPVDAEEFKELNGYGILLISSLSQDPAELPIKRAFISSGGEATELKLLKDLRMKQPTAGSQVSKTFGSYRVDSLYLFPVHLRLKKGELQIDFAKNRDGMKLAEFDGSVPQHLSKLPKTKPVDGVNIDRQIKAYLSREFPGYSDK